MHASQSISHTLSNPVAPDRVRPFEFSLGAQFVEGRAGGSDGGRSTSGHACGANEARRRQRRKRKRKGGVVGGPASGTGRENQ